MVNGGLLYIFSTGFPPKRVEGLRIAMKEKQRKTITCPGRFLIFFCSKRLKRKDPINEREGAHTRCQNTRQSGAERLALNFDFDKVAQFTFLCIDSVESAAGSVPNNVTFNHTVKQFCTPAHMFSGFESWDDITI
jgi:hypothetical protein